MSAILVRVLASRWIAALGFVGMTVVLWDSGFGRLAAFNDHFGAMATAFWEEEALFVFAIIIVQVSGLILMMTDRWIWLGAVALVGLGLLTMPGSLSWVQADESSWSIWAVAEYLSVFGIFVLTAILSALIRSGIAMPTPPAHGPELSWRQMVLAEEVSPHSAPQARGHSQRVFDRFYANLAKIAVKG